MTKLVTYLSRGDTESRLVQLEHAASPANARSSSTLSAESVRAAFAGDSEGFEHFLKELREGQGVYPRPSLSPPPAQRH